MTSSPTDLFLIYERLWKRAQADGMWVHYDGLMGDGLAGYFHPRDNLGRKMKPETAISRPYYKEPMDNPTRDSNAPPDMPQPNIVEELLTLAHEYGHSRSWAGQTPTDEYRRYYDAAKARGRDHAGGGEDDRFLALRSEAGRADSTSRPQADDR